MKSSITRKKLHKVVSIILVMVMLITSPGQYIVCKAMPNSSEESQADIMKQSPLERYELGPEINATYDSEWEQYLYTIPAGQTVCIKNTSLEADINIYAKDMVLEDDMTDKFCYVTYAEDEINDYGKSDSYWLEPNQYSYFTFNDNEEHIIQVEQKKDGDTQVYECLDDVICFETIEESKNYIITKSSQKYMVCKFVDSIWDMEDCSNYAMEIEAVTYDEKGMVCNRYLPLESELSLSVDESTAILTASMIKNGTTQVFFPMDYYYLGLAIKESDTPAFYPIDLKRNQTYVIDNTPGYYLDFSKKDSKEYNLAVLGYHENGGVTFQSGNDLPFGYEECKTIYMENREDSNEGRLYLPYRYIENGLSIQETQEPLFYEKTIENGKVVEISSTLENVNFRVNCGDNVEYKLLSFEDPDNRDIETMTGSEEFSLSKNGKFYIQAPESDAITIRIPNKLYGEEYVMISEKDCVLDEINTYDLKYQFEMSEYQYNIWAEEDEEPVVKETSYLDYYNITVQNMTSGKKVTEYEVDYVNQTISFSSAIFNNGDKIRVTFKKDNGASGNADIIIGDEKKKFEVDIFDNGYLQILVKDADEELDKVLVYDDNGNIVKNEYDYPMIEQWPSDNQFLLSGVPEGNYTVVYLKAQGYDCNNWMLDKLSMYSQIGATEGVDYLTAKVEIKSCAKNTVDFSEKSLNYTGVFDYLKSSRISINNEESILGKLIMVTLDYDLNDKKLTSLDKAKLVLNLDDVFLFKEGSLILDGELVKNYDWNSGTQELTITPSKAKGTYSFYVTATNYKEQAEIGAKFIVYDEENDPLNEQEIGSVYVDIPKLSLNVSSVTAKEEIKVSGLTTPNNTISIYSDNQLAQTTVSKSDGTYMATVKLDSVGTHEIYACAQVGDENVTTDSAYVEYNSDAVVAISNTMYIDGVPYDITDSEIQTEVITFAPGLNYYYELELANDENVFKVLITSTRNGVTSSIPAYKDEDTGKWVTKSKFNNDDDYVPGLISYRYFTKEQICFDKDNIGQITDVSKEVEKLTSDTIKKNVTKNEKTDDALEYQANITYDKDKTAIGKKYGKDVTVNFSQSVSKKEMTVKELKNAGYTKLDAQSDAYVKYDYGNGTLRVDSYISGYQNSYIVEAKEIADKVSSISDWVGVISQLAGMDESPIELPPEFYVASTFFNIVDDLNNPNYMNLPDAQRDKMAGAILFSNAVQLGLCFVDMNPIAGMVVGMIVSDLMETYLDSYAQYLRNGGTDNALEYFFSFRWIIDPSGYVYDEQTKKRLKGVKATLYYKDKDGNPVKWNAEEYSQKNSQYTDGEGNYAWDVPAGEWKVVFEKTNYAKTETGWLVVPPPQTGINIGMTWDGITVVESEHTKNHVVILKNQKDCTCTEDGYTGDEYCEDCDDVISTGEVIKAPGHKKFVKNKKSATYLKTGYTGDTYCSVCDKKLSTGKVIAKKKAKTQTISVKKSKVTLSYKKLKKGKIIYKLGAKAKGKLTYKIIKGNKRVVSVNKTGSVTFKKGTPKGTYKITIYAAPTTNGEYKKTNKTVTFVAA